MPEVEKRATEAMQVSGAIVLSDLERQSLDLPPVSRELKFEIAGDECAVTWSGARRQLAGEALRDFLQLDVRRGDLIRIALRGSRMTIVAVSPAESTITTPPRFVLQQETYRPSLPAPASPTKKKPQRRESRIAQRNEYTWRGKVGILKASVDGINESIKALGWDSAERWELRLQGERLGVLSDFDELLAVDAADIDPMPHQLAAARKALQAMRGRAVLADEVGLGKTIEAGLILKELVLRRLVQRCIIVCPSPLREQWQSELRDKFEIESDIIFSSGDALTSPVVIMTYALMLRRQPELEALGFDVLIVDEAHKALGNKTRAALGQLSSDTRYSLFLTATPVQNRLDEFHHLVQLVRPGTFRSLRDFKRQYVSSSDPRTPVRADELRRLVSQCVIRTTRDQAGVDLVQRHPVDIPVKLSDTELALYDACRVALRRFADNRADTRWRHLALRLSSSPFALTTTAMRMAENMVDREAKAALNEIASLGRSISVGAKERAAAKRIKSWVKEHGRVLVFSQHADSVTSLIRLLSDVDIPAGAFTGTMVQRARSDAIAKFKSGDVPVLVSTDAGAEGQNLQFCNCVLNFDLPWNPMRVEQRIGRVHRLKQTRDVHVGNLFAVGTIDESVYRLLHDKLRMFELLFGQVTTILGEVESDEDLTFEGKILAALTAKTDIEMHRRLEKLGSSLEDARARADKAATSANSISQWLASDDRHAHRKTLTTSASELRPEEVTITSARRDAVEAWTEQVLTAIGATTIHRTTGDDGRYLQALLPDDLSRQLGSQYLHLAFDRPGLDQHPEAQLCVVGSPMFDDLLAIMRPFGDISARVPMIPDSPHFRLPTTTADVTLVRAAVVHADQVTTQAAYRVQVGEDGKEQLLTVGPDRVEQNDGIDTYDLDEGQPFDLPIETKALIEQTVAAGYEEIESLLIAELDSQSENRQADAQRLQDYYDALIREATDAPNVGWDVVDRLELDKARQLSRALDVSSIEARAELLSVRIHGHQPRLQAAWSNEAGELFEIDEPWRPGGVARVMSRASGRTLRRFGLCASAHPIDETERTLCPSCAAYRCDACGDDGVFTACELCGIEACGACRTWGGGLCPWCAGVTRSPEHDDGDRLAYVVPSSAPRRTVLLLSQTDAIVSTENSEGRVYYVADTNASNDQQRQRAINAALGCAIDAPLTLHACAAPEHRPKDTVREATWRIDRVPTGVHHPDAVDKLWELLDHPSVPRTALTTPTVKKLFDRLRKSATMPVGAVPAVVERQTVLRVDADEHGLHETIIERDGLRGDDIVRSESAGWSVDDEKWTARTTELRATLRRVHRAFEVTIAGAIDPYVAVALPAGSSLAEEMTWSRALRELGATDCWVGRQSGQLPDDFANPTAATCEERSTVDDAVVVVRPDRPIETTPATTSDLALLGLDLVRDVPHIEDLSRYQEFAEAFAPSAQAVVQPRRLLREQWRSQHGVTARERFIGIGDSAKPLRDDDRESANDFSVCRSGHIHNPSRTWECPACHTWPCDACADEGSLAPCPDCGQAACGSCRSKTPVPMASLSCAVCGSASCGRCRPTFETTPCATCLRSACSSCTVDGVCVSCRALDSAVPQIVGRLPVGLRIGATPVSVAADATGSIVAIATATRRELAVVANDELIGWYTISEEGPPTRRARFALAAAIGEVTLPTLESGALPPVLPTIGAIELRRTERPTIVVHRADDTTPLLGPWPSPGAGTQIATTLANLPEAPTPTPPATTHHALSLRRILPQAISQPEPTILVSDSSEAEITWIDAEGLGSTRREAIVITQSHSGWEQPPDTDSISSMDGLHFERVLMASLPPHEVSLNRLGHALVVTSDLLSHPATVAIDVSDIRGAAAAKAIGLDHTIAVAGSVASRTDLVFTRVQNAPLAQESVSVDAHPAAGEADETIDLFDALASYDASLAPPPTFGDELIPERLGAAFREVVARYPSSIERAVIDLRITATRTFLVAGNPVTLQTTSSGSGDHRYRDVNTSELLDEGMIDRSNHVVAIAHHCAYCKSDTCPSCADPVQQCAVCHYLVCGRCSAESTLGVLCPACTSLGLRKRRHLSGDGFHGLFGKALYGADQHHRVIAMQDRDRWQIGIGSQTWIAPPDVGRWLALRAQEDPSP